MASELMAIDPDAPWWANLAVLLLVAAIPALVAWLSGRGTRRIAWDTKADVSRVLDNVANSHDKGLRDDLDEKVEGLLGKIDDVQRDVGGLHSEVRDTRADVGHVRDDIEGVRTDARRDRRRLSRLERVAATALDRAQAVIDDHHPGTQLRDTPDQPDTAT